VFRRFFETVVDQCQHAGLVWGKELYADAKKVQANAAVSSLKPRFAVEAHLNTLFPKEEEPNTLRGDGSLVDSFPQVVAEVPIMEEQAVSFKPQEAPNVYLCLNNAELHVLPSGSTDQYLQYRAKASACNSCPLKAKCTTSNTGRRLSRHVAEEYLERVRAYHTTEPYKKAMRKRSVWVEPFFAEGKDWHGMRRYRLRRLWRVNCEAFVRAAGQNLKRLLKNREWGRHPWPEGAENALLFGFFRYFQCFFSREERATPFC